MSCTAVKYADKPTARDVQHILQRRYHLSTSIRFCEEHNCFHTIVNMGRLKLPKRAIEVLNLLAQGFTQTEIAKLISEPRATVEWYARSLKDAFGAMTAAQLIGISIAVGAISSDVSLPGVIERNDYAGQNGERSGVAGKRSASG